MKNIMVIGSNSFSGSHFINLLLEKTTYDIIGVSRSPEKSSAFLPYRSRLQSKKIESEKALQSRFHFYQLNLNHDVQKIMDLIDKHQIEYIVNFAAQSEVAPSWKNPLHWYQTNVLSLVNLLNQLKDRNFIKKYVHASTPEVYGTMSGTIAEHTIYSPSTPYASSKAAAD